MRSAIAVVVTLVLTVPAGRAATDRVVYRVLGGLWGHSYEKTVLVSDLETNSAFDPERGEPPLSIEDAAGIARDWMNTQLSIHPSWVDEPVWRLREVVLFSVREGEYWLFNVVFTLGLAGREVTVGGSRFAVTVLMDGSVVEPVFSGTPETRGYPAPPRPMTDVESRDRLVTFLYMEAPLQDMLDLYSELSGWSVTDERGHSDQVLYDPVTMKVSRKLHVDEALSIMEDYLRAHSIVLEETGPGELAARLWRPVAPADNLFQLRSKTTASGDATAEGGRR